MSLQNLPAPTRVRRAGSCGRRLLLALLLGLSGISHAAPITTGADVSALPAIEKAGGVFRENGRPDDEIAILRRNGCRLFRVRLFVNPNPDFKATDGATQDLAAVRALAKRIKAAGREFLLDFHYSDTWADPQHQVPPKAWEGLDVDALEKHVGEYTTSVLKDLDAAGARPDMVQVGNEITSGILWPAGIVERAKTPQDLQQWAKFTRLINAGTKVVRAFEKGGASIKIMLHVHGGGRPNLPQYFFKQFIANGGKAADFDIIGLSFYPAWNDSLAALKANMKDLIAAHGKDVMLAEVGYPWAPVTHIEGRETMQWPMTKDGQLQFLRDVRQAMADAPGGHGVGYVWWYSDAIPVPGLRIWRGGNEALFDHDGNALPALSVFAETP